MRIRAYDGVQDQSILSRTGHQSRMVLASPGDGRLRPMHELGFYGHNSVHLCLMPKVIPFILAGGGKDVILLNIRREAIILIQLAPSRVMLLVPLTSSRLRLRRSRDLPSALLQLSHEPALTRGVGRFPARGVVELARLVKCSIEGVLALFAPLTAAGSPRASWSEATRFELADPLGNASTWSSHRWMCSAGGRAWDSDPGAGTGT
jgi:hypothetical protein